MKRKAKNLEYLNLEQIQSDFWLLAENAIVFNGKESIVAKQGLTVSEKGL